MEIITNYMSMMAQFNLWVIAGVLTLGIYKIAMWADVRL